VLRHLQHSKATPAAAAEQKPNPHLFTEMNPSRSSGGITFCTPAGTHWLSQLIRIYARPEIKSGAEALINIQ
jgi:hypothetical protein